MLETLSIWPGWPCWADQVKQLDPERKSLHLAELLDPQTRFGRLLRELWFYITA